MVRLKNLLRENEFVGYNDTLPPEFIPKGYLAKALNCFMRSREIVKRGGYSMIGNDLGSSACQAIKGARFADGTRRILAVFGGSIYVWSGSGNWSLASGGSGVLATSGLIDIVFAANSFYFFDGTNTVPKYDGTSVTTVASIPIGKYARWFHNQLHVAGMSGDPNALKSSDIGNPETFTGGNSSDLDINPNDGDEITALNELNDELIVFKRNRIWSMTGFGTSALTLAGLGEKLTGIGALSNWGIVNTGNDLLYPGFLGNRPIIRSLQRTRYGTIVDNGIVTEDIEGTMNELNNTQLTKSAGVFDGRYAWFAFASGSSTYNNLVITYDTIEKAWTKHTGINASCFTSFAVSNEAQLYFGEASSDSKAYVFDEGTSDNGNAINFEIVTRRYGEDDASTKKKYKWLYLVGKETGNYDLTIDYSKDGFDYQNLGTWNLSGTGSLFDGIVPDSSRLGSTDVNKERFEIPKSRDYSVQFKIYDNSSTSSVTIRSWDLYFYRKRPIDTLK